MVYPMLCYMAQSALIRVNPRPISSNNHFVSYRSLRAATPGSVFPSSIWRLAPPPVEI